MREVLGFRGRSLVAAAGFVFALGALIACVERPIIGAGTAAGSDAALAAFGQENPQCQLWTNWQKMCSRTGAGGEPHCVTDPDRRVTASAPFCAYSGEGGGAADLEGPDAGSVARYCARADVHGVYRGPGSDPNLRVRHCAAFRPARPFNGRNLAARRHPWCAEWSDTYSHRPVCSESGARNGPPSCSALARRGYRHVRPLYCSAYRLPGWCEAAEDMLDQPEPSASGVVLRDTRYRDSDFLPIHGIVCRRRTSP